ncbi:MAG: MaoC family dehydratase [bacterium]|nr:MaoC family dehydratase [bacterium]
MPNPSYKRTLDDFEAGQVVEHNTRKTVTESDNNLFCLLTMNHHPVHLDHAYAAEQQHGKILVVGTYVLSLVAGFSVPDISGMAIANLEYEAVVHNGPVFVGDTLRAETEVLDVRTSRSKPDRGVLYVETRAFNQKDERILTFRRKVLLPKRLQEGE